MDSDSVKDREYDKDPSFASAEEQYRWEILEVLRKLTIEDVPVVFYDLGYKDENMYDWEYFEYCLVSKILDKNPDNKELQVIKNGFFSKFKKMMGFTTYKVPAYINPSVFNQGGGISSTYMTGLSALSRCLASIATTHAELEKLWAGYLACKIIIENRSSFTIQAGKIYSKHGYVENKVKTDKGLKKLDEYYLNVAPWDAVGIYQRAAFISLLGVGGSLTYNINHSEAPFGSYLLKLSWENPFWSFRNNDTKIISFNGDKHFKVDCSTSSTKGRLPIHRIIICNR